MTSTAWTVTTTNFSTERYWGVRFDWLGPGYLLHIGVSRAPAIRIGLFGCTIWLGKIPPKPQVQVLTTKTVTTGGDYASGAIVTK
jgi:hypothetical protein